MPSWDELAADIDRLNRTNPREALVRAESWLAAERESGSAEGYARALRAHAHALRFLGMYETAVAQYEEAESRFQALDLEAAAARTRIGHVTTLRLLGRYHEAVELAQRTRAYFLDQGDELQAAKQANNLGTIYRPMGRFREAVQAYRAARAVFRRLGEDSSLADVEQNLGNVLVELGRYEQAVSSLRAAERIRRALGLQAEVAYTLLNIGSLSYRRGDYGQALEALTESRAIYESLKVDRGATEVDLDLLRTCSALNLREESRAAAERAIAGLRALEMPFELAQALLAAGALAEASEDRSLARLRSDEARQLAVRIGNRFLESIARLQAARLALADGDEAELRAALRECQTATRRLEGAGALDRAAYGRLVEGALLARLGAPAEALKCFRQALESATALGADHLLFQAHAAVGELLEPTAPETAIASYRLAIDHLETVRARARADDLKLSFLADKTDMYERVVGLLLRHESVKAIADAYDFVERSKSRTLLEELLAGDWAAPRGRRSRVDKLVRKVRDIRTRLNAAYTLAYGGDETPSSDALGRSGQAQLVSSLEQEFARATRELQLAARGAQDARATSEANAVEDETALPTGTALVEFFTVNDELVAFVRTDSGLQLRRLTRMYEVARLVRRLGFHIGKGAFGADYLRANLEGLRGRVDGCLHALWEAVIKPLEPDLRGRDRLIVVPHGPLHGLPFHAFHDGDGYLAERFAVSCVPSAGVYQNCRRLAGPLGLRALVVGVEDPNLPWVTREIETVASAWPRVTVLAGREATGQELRRQIGKFDILHVASHAVFRRDNPAFSLLKLADGWLTVADLGELARGAQMVTLSACETGLGGLSVGDEVVGLTRGILGAGCSTVVASLWPVSDDTTARLMGRFYADLQNGTAAADALRSAMLAVRSEHDHPYFWAPFVVTGGGDPAAQSGRSTTRSGGGSPSWVKVV